MAFFFTSYIPTFLHKKKSRYYDIGGRAYPVRHYPVAIRLRDRKGRAILCIALFPSEWGLFGRNTRSAIRGTSSRKCFGKTKNGTPRFGPKEMYIYHKHQGKWSASVESNRQLFKVAQQQAIAEMNDSERLAHWQKLFEEQLEKPQLGEKQYVKLQCYIVAQLLKAMKAG